MIKYKQQLALKRHGWKADAKRADKLIYYCCSCKKCWETIEARSYMKSGNYHTIIYLHDFPTYGKQKQTCPNCK
tara:strand:+ start:21698 stop:21919 length:222 start_codon:yes stop_codon:yes gene_type:complete